MPHILRNIVLALAGSLMLMGTACEPASEPVIQTQIYLIGVQGMHCDGCANAIATKASRVEGVASCEVSLDEATATVVAVPASIKEVESAISALGYTITPATAG